MKRRLLILALIVVLFSTFFSLSGPGLSSPKVARAAGCTTKSATLSLTSVFMDPITFITTSITNPPVVSVSFTASDTITVTWPGSVNQALNLVTGNMDIFLGPVISYSMNPTTYVITVCSAGTSGGQATSLVTTTNFTDGR